MRDDDVRIYSAVTSSGLTFDVTGDPGDLFFRVDEMVHLFFSDGRYRREWPDGGLLGDLAADQAKRPGEWGRWRRDGVGLIVEWGNGFVTRYVAQDDAIVDENGTRFGRLPYRQGGIDLTGRWLRVAAISDKPQIHFSTAERFETRGGLMGLMAMPAFVIDWGPYPPDSLFQWPDGAGHYALDCYTLALRRDDGPVVAMLAIATAPDRVRLGFTWFQRLAR